MSGVYDFTAKRQDGREESLADYAGRVLLIVNTASRCGFTPQYAGLETLYQSYRERGLTVLGFPCNQFLGQEPGTDDEIRQFCELNYGVTFPLFSKVEVNGAAAHPLFAYLTHALPGALGLEGVKWNFTKFLVDRRGVPIKRYAPTTSPDALCADIEAALG